MKSTFIFFLVSTFGTGVLAAQDSTQVTFSVYMGDVDRFDPSLDVLRVAGDFQRWNPTDPTGANILADADGDSIYTVTMPIAVDTILFKYVINNWDGSAARSGNEFISDFPENVNECTRRNGDETNRVEGIPSNTATHGLPLYAYNTCDFIGEVLSVETFRELTGVRVSPNPMRDRATLSLPAQAAGSYNVRVLGTDGRQLVQAQNFTGTSYDIERGNLVAGIYLVEVVNVSAGERAVLRLAVE